jgi:hypothetical protein
MSKLNMLIQPLLFGACSMAILCVRPAVVLAQEDDEAIPVDEPAPPGEAEEGEGAPPPKKAPGKGAEEGTPQVSETHLVQGGDTLWDLCSKYLNSPWYWPKIWSYNPQITNPHWIYPGNELRFYPSDENLPTNVEVSAQMSVPNKPDDTAVPDSIDNEDLVKSTGIITRGVPTSYAASFIGYVSPKAQEQAGEIVNADSEAYMLSDYDRTYVKLKAPAKKGENYAIYRTIKELEHPVTGEPYGYAVEIIGGMTIIDVSPTVATGQIAQTYRPVERGDYVGHWPENFGHRVNQVPNDAESQGYIIETLGEVLTEVGEHHVVFVDRGKKDGLKQGNTFTVVARGDAYTQDTAGLPNEDIGTLMVIDVQEKAATCVVTSSLRELAVGDKVEMRKQ